MDINCEVLLQEFNKYLLFLYNNAMDQLVTVWTNHKEQQFFFNTEYIQQYNAAKPESKKMRWLYKIMYDYWRNVSRADCENESVDPSSRHQQTSKVSLSACCRNTLTNTDDSKKEKWMIIEHVQSESTKRMKSISRIVQVFRPFATDTLLKKVLWKNT